jgi:hypothetical protein
MRRSMRSRIRRARTTVITSRSRSSPTNSDPRIGTTTARLRTFRRTDSRWGPRAANRYLIDIDGKVSDIERVFHVTMGVYRHPSEARDFVSPDRLPTVDLQTPIQQVIGLDDFVLPYRHLVRGESEERTTGSGPGGNFIGSDIRKAYYPKGTLAGEGQSIGLMELAGVDLSDVTEVLRRKAMAPRTPFPSI